MATKAYSKKWNMPYDIPTVTSNKIWKHYRFPGIHYEDVNTRNFFHYREPAIEYDKRPYDITSQDIPYHENILLEGHFLSHKYWWDYKDEIFKLFGFKIGRFYGHASIHQRRGDYLNMQEYLPSMNVEYYDKAINWVIKNTGIKKFLVFSDDLIWCRENINLINFPQCNKIEYSEGRNEIKDLELMASCQVNIIANSTFSLMSHYLNKCEDKICVAPENWYGPAYGEVNKQDMYYPESILL